MGIELDLDLGLHSPGVLLQLHRVDERLVLHQPVVLVGVGLISSHVLRVDVLSALDVNLAVVAV